MLFGKEEEKQRKEKRAEKKRSWKGRLHKLIFLTGLAIAFKGLKGWLRNKKREISR